MHLNSPTRDSRASSFPRGPICVDFEPSRPLFKMSLRRKIFKANRVRDLLIDWLQFSHGSGIMVLSVSQPIRHGKDRSPHRASGPLRRKSGNRFLQKLPAGSRRGRSPCFGKAFSSDSCLGAREASTRQSFVSPDHVHCLSPSWSEPLARRWELT